MPQLFCCKCTGSVMQCGRIYNKIVRSAHGTEGSRMMAHIMVVDDDTANLRTAGHILSKNHMRVTALDSGEAMLNSIQKDDLPDLILLDIKMPEMDGFEALSRLRILEKEIGIEEIPVIFLTANEAPDMERQGFEAGVSDYIRKPFDPDILLRRVGNIISKEKRLSSLRSEAETDMLTGFLNKIASARALSSLCASDLGCLMLVDLDSFKLVNDLFGHKMGDNFLICFSAILRGTAPEGSVIGRIGGDEFIVFSSGMQTEKEIAAFSEQINRELLEKAKELMGEDMGIPLGASVGAVFVPMHGDDYESLFRLADQAMYEVKKNGKHGYSLYCAEIAPEEMLQTSVHDIDKLSEILGERFVPNMALQLDRDAFSYVYRYIMRYMIRNRRSLYKVLFTLLPEDGIAERDFIDACDAFGSHIRASLRKTDILMRDRFNQYFVLLTDIRKNDIDIVTGNIMNRWELNGGSGLNVSFETEFVCVDLQFPKHAGDVRIAAADDDEAVLQLIGHTLSKAGFRVSAVKSGRALIKYVSEQKPDLILLDTVMPAQDGFETLQLLRGIQGAAEIPVILLTEDNQPETDCKCLSLGADEIIRKPVVPELLLHRVRHVTELAARRGASHASR